MFVSMHDNVFVIMFHHTNLYIVDQFHGLDHFNTRGPTMSGSHRYLNATMILDVKCGCPLSYI